MRILDHKDIGYYAMYIITLLEINTPLLHIGFLLKELKFHYSIVISSWTIHLFSFIFCRLILLPRILFLYYYMEGMDKQTLLEIPCFGLILLGSVYWSYRQSLGIIKYLKEYSLL